MSSKKRIEIGELQGYPYVECDTSTGINLLNKISERLGYVSEDLRDSIRILSNYDDFYSYMKKKGKEFIVPSKRESDFIRGRVVIDKIKLLEGRRAVIVFDRRINRSLIENVVYEFLS
ncbi:MAG: hypothetical protein QXJ51_02990 [Sulfolobales archaeon]